MDSLIEQLRSKNGIHISFGVAGEYSIDIDKTGVAVNGCDCTSCPTDDQVRAIHEALGAYLRHLRNREVK